MPTYDYRCESCSDVFEVFHKINDAPVASCPKCGGKVKKLISGGGGILFKGSGFYVTDYKKSVAPSGEKIEPKKVAETAPAASEKTPAKTVE